jgi:uncharacterized protein (TIGR03118 family)
MFFCELQRNALQVNFFPVGRYSVADYQHSAQSTETLMRFARAAAYAAIGTFGIPILLAGCGGAGGGGAGGGSPATPTPSTVSVKVSPASVTVGQTTTVSWSSSSGTSCTASGAWSGSQPVTGSTVITPTATGSETFSLSCSGGVYSSGSGSATLTVTAAPASASAYTLTDLVVDAAGGSAKNVDPRLVNPWGLSIGGTNPAWIANNHTSTATLYDGNGKAQPQPASNQIIANFAPSSTGAAFAPTGIVYNAGASDFLVKSGTASGAALYIVDGEGGMIAGWSPAVSLTNAVTMYTDTGGAEYTGLAIATHASKPYLYAADFHNHKIDVFDSTFAKQTTSTSSFTFMDPAIGAGFSPFGIQAINNGAGGAPQIYVTYAQQSSAGTDATNGGGQGYLDVYDTNGQLISHLISVGGALNAPWGLALAPANFGIFSNALLVGNFGDGRVNAFDAGKGTLMGTISDSSGAALATPGLWGLAFGNGANNQPANTLFFAAGPNGMANGVYGRIDLGSMPPTLNAPPEVTLTAPTGSLSGTVELTAAVVDPIAVTKVDFYADSTLIGTATAAPYTINWNTTTVTTASESLSLSAKATDADGSVGSSTAITVSVNNGPPPPTGYTLPRH